METLRLGDDALLLCFRFPMGSIQLDGAGALALVLAVAWGIFQFILCVRERERVCVCVKYCTYLVWGMCLF